jgi:hypothetical protein
MASGQDSGRIEFTKQHFYRDCFTGLVEESAVGRPFFGVGDRPIKVSLGGAIDEGLGAGRIRGCHYVESIPTIGDTERVFARRT